MTSSIKSFLSVEDNKFSFLGNSLDIDVAAG